MTQVLGVIVLARNGDRLEYYQDPKNYGASFTETTPLGEVSPVQPASSCGLFNPSKMHRSNPTTSVLC